MAVDTRDARASRDRHLRLLPGGDPARHPGNREQNGRTVLMLWISTGFLTFAGLLMVLSASSIWAYAQYGSGFFFFERQAIYAVVGLAIAYGTFRRGRKQLISAAFAAPVRREPSTNPTIATKVLSSPKPATSTQTWGVEGDGRRALPEPIAISQ